MEVNVLSEWGYDLALYGISLSYKDRSIPFENWFFYSEYQGNRERLDALKKQERSKQVSQGLAKLGKGHDKFLRQIMLWVDIEAPRYWWSEFDTYKIGTVAQSESTMHTLLRRPVTREDFEGKCLSEMELAAFNKRLEKAKKTKDISSIKKYLPESYLQRRLVTLNYSVLRCIIGQRRDHKLSEWQLFINRVMESVEHPEYLQDLVRSEESNRNE